MVTPAKDRAATYRAKQLALRTAQAKRVEELEAALKQIAVFETVRVTASDGFYFVCLAKNALEGIVKP